MGNPKRWRIDRAVESNDFTIFSDYVGDVTSLRRILRVARHAARKGFLRVGQRFHDEACTIMARDSDQSL